MVWAEALRHQNFPAPVAPANFSILFFTMVGTWGGGGLGSGPAPGHPPWLQTCIFALTSFGLAMLHLPLQADVPTPETWTRQQGHGLTSLEATFAHVCVENAKHFGLLLGNASDHPNFHAHIAQYVTVYIQMRAQCNHVPKELVSRKFRQFLEVLSLWSVSSCLQSQ